MQTLNKLINSYKSQTIWDRLPSEQVVVPKHHFYCATAMISPQFPDPPKQLPNWYLIQAKIIFNNFLSKVENVAENNFYTTAIATHKQGQDHFISHN